MYFFGYHVYTLVAAVSPYDLPLYPRLQRATRHDAISWVVSAQEFANRFPGYTWRTAILDAAHDARPIYDYLQARQIRAFIDLNDRSTRRTGARPEEITYSATGVPICRKGLPMKDRGKWRRNAIRGCFPRWPGIARRGPRCTIVAPVANGATSGSKKIST